VVFFAVLLLVAAGVLFSFLEPLYSSQILKATIAACITVGLASLAAGSQPDTPEVAPSPFVPVRTLAATLILIVGVVVCYSFFANPTLPILMAAIVVLPLAYLAFSFLRRRGDGDTEDLSTGLLSRTDANLSPLQAHSQLLRLSFLRPLLELKGSLQQLVAGQVQLHEQTRVMPSRSDATIAAHKAAAKRKIPPQVYDLPEMHLGEQQVKTDLEMKFNEVKARRAEMGVDYEFAVKTDKYKQQQRRRREQEERTRSAQAGHGPNVEPDIPNPERSTDD
jgi:hypothetical protein